MNIKLNHLLIPLLVVSLTGNVLFYFKIDNFNNVENKETENQMQTKGLKLIKNEYTKNLDELSERWNIYHNKEYDFKINYPEAFEDKKIEIEEISFDSREHFYSIQKHEEVCATPPSGSFKTARHLIDFNITEDKMIEGQMFEIKQSLFTITIHPNKSNLSFKDFVSQEILSFYKGREIIKEQRIVKINGIEGYRFVCSQQSLQEFVYYLPSQDNKMIFSISTGIMPLSEILKSDDPYFEFSKINSQYQKEFYDTENPVNYESHSEFIEKYPDYEKFINRFSFKHKEKELNKRLMFEKIVYSFKFH